MVQEARPPNVFQPYSCIRNLTRSSAVEDRPARRSESVKQEMDMGPYLLTQPNSKWTKPNPTQPMIFLHWRDPTQPTFRNTVLRKDTINSLGYNLQYEPRCPKCLTEQYRVSEIVYQSMTNAHLSKTVYGSCPCTCTSVHRDSMPSSIDVCDCICLKLQLRSM